MGPRGVSEELAEKRTVRPIGAGLRLESKFLETAEAPVTTDAAPVRCMKNETPVLNESTPQGSLQVGHPGLQVSPTVHP